MNCEPGPLSAGKHWSTPCENDWPGVQVVQLGVADSPILEGVVSLCGKTNFRQAALVQRSSALFVGTEGGLMHAAAAVGAPSVILWGGVTIPGFRRVSPASRYHLQKCLLCAMWPFGMVR